MPQKRLEFTDEMIARGLKLKAAGFPTAAIAVELGFTADDKVAVNAKLNRALERMGEKPIPPSTTQTKAQRMAERQARAAASQPKPPATVVQLPPPRMPNPHPPKLPPAGGCKWPMWPHGERPTHEYCGDARFSAVSPYCRRHARKARSQVA